MHTTAPTNRTTRSPKAAARLAAAVLALGMLASCASNGASGTPLGKHKGPSTDKTIPKDHQKDEPDGKDDHGKQGDDGTTTDGNDGGSTTNGGDDVSPEVKEFAEELRAVAENAEIFWSNQITDGNGSSTYEAPDEILTYVGSEPDHPTCGGQEVPAENSFFCSADNTMIFDVEWLYSEYQDIGDMFLYVVVQHEYGHSAQYNLGDPGESAVELQADCFAGAELQWELDLGTVTEEQGDEEEINQTLASLSGEYGTSDNHGTLSQRASAFEYGRSDGPAACQWPEDYFG
jgi:predicted metalloprotease